MLISGIICALILRDTPEPTRTLNSIEKNKLLRNVMSENVRFLVVLRFLPNRGQNNYCKML